MELTKELKQWIVENIEGISKTSTDDEMRRAAAEAIVDGKLTTELLNKLAPPKIDEGEERVKTLISDSLAPAMAAIEKLTAQIGQQPPSSELEGETVMSRTDTVDDDLDNRMQRIEASLQRVQDGDGGGSEPSGKPPIDSNALTPEKLFSHAAEVRSDSVRVKDAVEQYDGTKRAAFYPEKNANGQPHMLAGRRAEHCGRGLDHPSDQDRAIGGAFFKWSASQSMARVAGAIPHWLRMTDHDKQIMDYALHNCRWTGLYGCAGHGDNVGTDSPGGNVKALYGTKLTPLQRKQLLDDTLSGGLEAVPVVVDDDLIIIPTLFGELFPLVNTVSVPRGRRVEGTTLGTLTITSGTAEGTAIGLFATASFVGAFDTTIFNAVGAIRIGLDFLEDSPIAMGQAITSEYGVKMMEWLDEQIAIGDGTTEPEGIFNASGTASISSANGTSGAPTVGDYEGLMFGVAKEFQPATDRARIVFLANEVSYRRARAIAVGTTDERRVFGMDHQSYTLLSHPYKIQSSITNAQMAFANLRYYRMYRRLGIQIRVETGGETLARANLQLIVIRSRYGGQLELGGAASVMTDGQSGV